MGNPDWDECKTCKGRELCHGEETLESHNMSGPLLHDLVAHDPEAMAFFQGRADELLELQEQTGMDTRWMILHGLLNGAVWAVCRE